MLGNISTTTSSSSQHHHTELKSFLPTDEIQSLNDIHLVLFKQSLYSNATIQINNQTYLVHREILSNTSGYFSAYFSEHFDINIYKNIEVKDLHDELADSEMIDAVFKVLYNSFGCSTVESEKKRPTIKMTEPITRENLLYRLNLFYLLSFFCFNMIDEYDQPLVQFKENMVVLFKRLKGVYDTIFKEQKGNWKDYIPHREVAESINLLNQFLVMFRDKNPDKLIKQDSKTTILYNGLRYNYNDNDFWLTYLYINTAAPLFCLSNEIHCDNITCSNLPLFRKVKRLPRFDLNVLRNMLVLDEEYIFMASLLDFDHEIIRLFHTIRSTSPQTEEIVLNEDEVKEMRLFFISTTQDMFSVPFSLYINQLFLTLFHPVLYK